jgi:hypothetical protein
MANGFLAGMTDYSHQSLMDIVRDLQAEEKNVATFVEKIKANLETVSDNGYWEVM